MIWVFPENCLTGCLDGQRYQRLSTRLLMQSMENKQEEPNRPHLLGNFSIMAVILSRSHSSFFPHLKLLKLTLKP